MTGRNLVLLTKYRGADPETAAAGAGVRGGGSNGFDYGNVPATRGVDMGRAGEFLGLYENCSQQNVACRNASPPKLSASFKRSNRI